MSDKKTKKEHWSATTQAIRTGISRSPEGEHCEAILLTSSYIFSSAEEAAARFSGEQAGNIYSRYTNPTVRSFEERFAAVEGAEAAIAVSSGMAAILAVFMSFLQEGDHLVCSRSVFGSTIALLDKFFVKFGIQVDYAVAGDYADWQAKINDKTRLVFLETPSNPLNEIVDIQKVAQMAQAKKALLVIDNTYCTPILQQPLTLGADLCVYSATKYIDGQGRALGGVITGSRQLIDELVGFVRSAGPSMSPFNAWLFLKGLETLELRMQRHVETALRLAQWLEQQEKVERVYYSGLKSHPAHALASAQHAGRGFAAVVSFDIRGDQAAAWRFINAVSLFSLTANLGDAKSTIIHPATTTHSRVSPEMREAVGIKESLIRISIGLEAYEDMVVDLAQGFAAI